ncbi:MAG: DUF1592 domain-containing protein [Polyangiaceae bacterium]
MLPLRRRLAVLSAAVLTAAGALLVGAAFGGCTGEIGDPPDPITHHEELICDDGSIHPGSQPIRRLTRFEYNNTIRSLLGDTTNPANQLPVEEQDQNIGFNNTAALLVVNDGLALKYMTMAEGVSARATLDVAGLTGCDATHQDEACASAWIDKFGKRAYRRPLDADEKAALLGVFKDGVVQGGGGAPGFLQGTQMVIEAALQSPEFMYRIEIDGALDPSLGEGIVRLSDYEMASRLSYMIWGSMPDDALFAAADAGALRTKEQIATQARRMLDDPQARLMVDEFHLEWLDYDHIQNVAKDAAIFPDWSTHVGQLMQEETREFIDHAVFEGNGDLRALLTANYSYMNQELASFYGVSAPNATESFARVDLDPAQHAGILSLGALMSIYAHTNQTSPVHRGKLVRERLLCGVLKPPPNNFKAPEPDPNATTRERFEQHRTDPACNACHKLMDPLGFGLENFDPVGRYRTMDGVNPVDAKGELTETDVDGEFDGAIDLASRLADSHTVEQCYATQWFRFGYGRAENEEDKCTMSAIDQAFAESGGNVRELIVALTQTDAFLYRKAAN